MLEFFGAKNGRDSSRRAHIRKEFEEAFSLPEYEEPTSIQVSHVPPPGSMRLRDEY